MDHDDYRKMIVDLYHSDQKGKDLSSEYGFPKSRFFHGLKSLLL